MPLTEQQHLSREAIYDQAIADYLAGRTNREELLAALNRSRLVVGAPMYNLREINGMIQELDYIKGLSQ